MWKQRLGCLFWVCLLVVGYLLLRSTPEEERRKEAAKQRRIHDSQVSCRNAELHLQRVQKELDVDTDVIKFATQDRDDACFPVESAYLHELSSQPNQ